MELFLIILFVVNVVLVLADASVAYHNAPRFVSIVNADPEGQVVGAQQIKSILPLLVALYVSLDCYAHSLRHPGYLAGVTLLLAGDILVQLILTRKGKKGASAP